jgi:hypothetical protein
MEGNLAARPRIRERKEGRGSDRKVEQMIGP